MPLNLPSISAAIVCDGKDLETYDVKQEGTSSLSAFVASEVGKQFKVMYSNKLSNFELVFFLHIDGRIIESTLLKPGQSSEFLGLYKNERSILPFKFQELQLVDPDLEDAPVAPEMGTIEIKAFRCQTRCIIGSLAQIVQEDLHQGRVSELSKKAGWHHIATGDEIPVRKRGARVDVTYFDLWPNSPHASIKVFYRPRELLRAQGIIPLGNDAGRRASPTDSKKRAREDGSPRSRPKIRIKREELSGDARAQRIRALQAELDALKSAEQSGSPVKRELRSPSPIVVKHSGEVVDLTLDD